MRLGGVDLVRASVPDVRAHDDQRRALIVSALAASIARSSALEIVDVCDVLNVPAVRRESSPVSSLKVRSVSPSIVM